MYILTIVSEFLGTKCLLMFAFSPFLTLNISNILKLKLEIDY